MPQKAGSTKRTRFAPANVPSKKPKLASGREISVAKGAKSKGKQRAFQRTTITIPEAPSDTESVSDQDVQFFEENTLAGSFLHQLDRNGIARSKKETERLHKISKPSCPIPSIASLPSIDFHDDAGSDWSDGSTFESSPSESPLDNFRDPTSIGQDSDSDVEQHYEREPRKRQGSWGSEDAGTVAKLPIKLADGRIVKTGGRGISEAESESEVEKSHFPVVYQEFIVEDVSTGARFGRPAVADVVGTPSPAVRIQMAKEQIAGICQDILSDPENSLGLLRRLHTFSLPYVATSQPLTLVKNDSLIRRLAMMSQFIVFKDIIPGYRIRPLTDPEKAEKVSQMVGKTREWEQGLVSVYQTYLKALESELKGRTEFCDLALKLICALLKEATQFNFRTNLMATVVARLSRRSWDASSELCLNTLISIFREDVTGVPSLEVVRLLNRMVKERRFAVHPNALSCLFHLRLKSELGGIRASESKADKVDSAIAKRKSRGQLDRKRAKGKKVEKPHLSKKSVKVLKERKEIEEQMREAEAEVDQEERASRQTETLKLLFVLYFRILKAPQWTPLLPSTLQGLCRYAHLVNIDFFKDLLEVLKELISRTPIGITGANEQSNEVSEDQLIQHRLLCIATAFELLSGQGEALNIDLRDFVNHLYALILPISLQPDIESSRNGAAATRKHDTTFQQCNADLLFHTLSLVFSIRAAGTSSPIRTAAFAKRLVIACLSLPPTTALRSLEFVRGLLVKEPKLQALLSTDDRAVDGIYRPELDDPQLSNPLGSSFWELAHLAEAHWNRKVREMALRLSQFDVT